MKIYSSGDLVILENTVNSEKVFWHKGDVDYVLNGTILLITNVSEGVLWQDTYANMQDESGVGIGVEADIQAYISAMYVDGSGGGAAVWGSITGTLADQTDLVSALALKEGTITAGTTAQYYRGDKTWQTLNKAAVGLSNVDNVADADKPISDDTQDALDLKADEADLQAHELDTANPHLVDANDVGLGNVDNTPDLSKPISTATQDALNLKPDSFIELSDAPSAYTGKKGNFPIVNDGETALVFTSLGYRCEDLGSHIQLINLTDVVYTFSGDYMDACTLTKSSDPSSVVLSWSITSQTANQILIKVTTHATNVGFAEFSLDSPSGDLGVVLELEVEAAPSVTTFIGDTGAVWQNTTTNFTGGVGTFEKNVAGTGWNASGDTYTGYKIPLGQDFEMTWGVQDMGGTNFTITGLSAVPSGGGHTTDFYIYTNSTTNMQAAENGVNVGGYHSFVLTDTFMIKAVGTLLTYWKNGVLFATSPTSRNMDLYVEGQGYTQMRIINLKVKLYT